MRVFWKIAKYNARYEVPGQKHEKIFFVILAFPGAENVFWNDCGGFERRNGIHFSTCPPRVGGVGLCLRRVMDGRHVGSGGYCIACALLLIGEGEANHS